MKIKRVASRYLLIAALDLNAIAVLSLGGPVKMAASGMTPQGKGGQVVVKPTPAPAPKKTTTTRRTTPARKTGPEKSPSDSAAAAEMIFWNSIKDSTNAEDYRAYLKKYPSGEFADLANNRIKGLEAVKAQPSPVATPIPEPVYEWSKPERDLPARVQLEFHNHQLSFAVPSGWTRAQQEEGTHYLQVNFRAPDSPQTNISIQFYQEGIPRTWRNGAADVWFDEKKLVNDHRKPYASQNVSAGLTDTEVVNHFTGRWYTFTAELFDVNALERLVPRLDAAYPDDVWEKERTSGDFTYYQIKRGSLSAFSHTRHSYAIRQAGGDSGDFIIVLYTAPIDKFDEKMLPSVMATLKMSGGKLDVSLESSDPSVGNSGLSKYEPEIVVDGERKTGTRVEFTVSAGKHHIMVRAKEHKPFEKDVSVAGWEGDVFVPIKLERIASGASGAKPN